MRVGAPAKHLEQDQRRAVEVTEIAVRLRRICIGCHVAILYAVIN